MLIKHLLCDFIVIVMLPVVIATKLSTDKTAVLKPVLSKSA